MKHLIAVALLFALAGQPLWAATPDQKHLEKVRDKVSQCLESGRHVSIETYDGRKFAGTISQAGADDFVLASVAGSTMFLYSDVKKIKSPMDPHKRGVIVSIAVLGGLLGTTLVAAAHDR